MGAPNMPDDPDEKGEGEVDGDKKRYLRMYEHVEEHLITLRRYADARTADEESTKDIFELIDKYALRRHWKRLAPLLVVAFCFEPESIACYVKRCKRQQANGEWKLPCEYVETLWKNNLYDVFDYFNPRFGSRAWRILFSSMNTQQLQRKHRVPPLARLLTKQDDEAVQKCVKKFFPKLQRRYGTKIYSLRWFTKTWRFPTSVKIPAYSTWAMMLALAGNWKALCDYLYIWAMCDFKEVKGMLEGVSRPWRKFTRNVLANTVHGDGPHLRFSAEVCQLIWAFLGVPREFPNNCAFKAGLAITNGDGDNLRGVLERLATPENPEARLIMKCLDEAHVMNDGALLEAALSQLKRDVFFCPLIDPDSLINLDLLIDLQAD